MKRKRLTQVFPFLLPIRKWQRKKLFYLEMLIDGNKYAKNKSEALLPDTVFETSTLMLNKNSGVESFPSTTEDLPCGTDATINEGWLDLKIRNDTDNTFQIEISFDDKYMYGRILLQSPVNIVIFCILRAKKQPAEGAPLRDASCRPSFILYPYARASRHLNMQTKMLLFCTFGDIIKNREKMLMR